MLHSSRLLGFPANIKILKCAVMKNNLACYGMALIMVVNSFKAKILGACAIKIFKDIIKSLL